MAMAHRSGIVLADYSTNQTWAACPSWGTQNITLVLYPVTYTIATNCTIPSNVTLQFSHGSCLAPAVGTTTTIKGYFTAPTSKIFCNAVAGEGAIRLASADASDEGGQSLVDVYPEWWGATAGDASGMTNTPALQAAIIGAYGNNRAHSTAYQKYNRVLHFSTLYNINGELQVYHMIGFRWEGENQFGSGLRQRTCGLRIIDGQSVAYGRFENLRFENGCGGKSGTALIDVDYSGAQGADLRPQNITFYDDFFAGDGVTDVGVHIAKSGGGAQGDNIRCYNCYFNGFTYAAWLIGGIDGSTLATNAIREQITGGDIQNCPKYGVASFGGSVDVIGTTMENGFSNQSGFDVYCAYTVAGDHCAVQGVRTESRRLAAGGWLILRDDELVDQAFLPTPGKSPAVGAIIEGSLAGGNGVWYKITVPGVFSGLGTPTSPRTAKGGTATTIVDSVGGLTNNAYVGFLATTISGTAANQYCVITGNDATNLTCSGGWRTNYQNASTATPDATTTFIVEPNWGTQFSSGGATWAVLGENSIEGTKGGATNAVIDNLFVAGGTIKLDGRSTLRNLRTTRADWNSGSVPYTGYQGVQVIDQNNSNEKFRKWRGVTFSTLPKNAPDGGPPIYCSDCNSTCTAGSSTGRTCFRENGAWTH
jgi:hypothetical protein